jgi:predicted transglutaminase-like protease
MKGIFMINNYPIKNIKQHEHPKFSYVDYLDTSDEVFIDNTPSDSSLNVELEMSSSIYDMRREFKRTVKKLRKLYKSKPPKMPAYEYESARYARIYLGRSRVTG